MRGAGLRNVETLRGAPQTLDVVKDAHLFAENVNDEVTVVKQKPLGAGASFTMRKPHAVRMEQPLDLVTYGVDLTRALRRANHKILDEGAKTRKRHHRHGSGFLVLGRFDGPANRIGQGVQVHRYRACLRM